MTKAETSDDFLKTLEDGVRDVLKDKKSKSSERVAAITAGVKIVFAKHKIKESESTGFFS